LALNQTQAQILANVRQFTDTAGTTALSRHPNANIYDYINRAHGSLHRLLTECGLGDRFLSSTTVTTSSGTATYSLPATFDHLISVDLTANGTKSWLTAYEMHERPMLTDSSASYSGIPVAYRLRGSNIEYLPTPAGVYTSTLWFTPTPTNWATDGTDSASNFDTINRLDEYIIAYASAPVFFKDKNFDAYQMALGIVDRMADEVRGMAHARDRNSPPRPVDDSPRDRWGRGARIPARWR
jgi:hypothetical protein